MSDMPGEEQQPEQPSAPAAKKDTKKTQHQPKRVFLVPYPKVVFFYPAYVVAIVIAIWMAITDQYDIKTDETLAVAATWIFLATLSVNLVIITFDFPRATSLTMLFLVVALVLGTILLCMFNEDLLPAVTKIVTAIHPLANATFYMVFCAVMTLIYIGVFISVRFDYWEVRPNELLHHHGILSDLKRYSAPNLRVDKEINDVFEFLLLRSGRLILQPSNERRAITLENVPFISQKEQAITAMLGALQVQVRPDD